jgi:hypothetical protein
MQELKKSINTVTGMICLAIVALAIVASVSHYVVHEKTLMSQNIESAIQKGIDPLSVRCSYAAADDVVCVTFASGSQPISFSGGK